LKAFTLSVLALCCFAKAQSPEPRQQPKNTFAMAQHYGHGTPPVSPLTGMDQKAVSVPPFKGHWTLLYYWADWCVPCIDEGIPALTAFAEKHSHDHDAYRIIAIRFNSTDEEGDWNTFHTKTERLERTLWHRIPPFPIVYDSTTRMTSDWGIHELPTYALIDPHGNLMRGGNLSMLEQALQRDTK